MVRSQTEIKRLVREYVNSLEPTINVDRIILYGSYANGRPHRWSDIDLAIVSRDFAKKSLWQRQGILGHALKNSDAMIEALGYSLAEYNRSIPQTFLGEIKRTGKVIYTRRKRRTATPRRP
jgi:predicted nucleotidyltransferase